MRNIAGPISFRSTRIAFWAVLGFSVFPAPARAQYVLEDDHNSHRYDPDYIAVPVGYYNSGLQLAGGAAGYVTGYLQRQMDEYVFLIAGTNGSYGAVFGLDNLQLHPLDRLFLDFNVNYVRTEQDTNNIPGKPTFPHQTAGNNDSSQYNYIPSASNDAVGSFTFKYVLPIGDGRETVIDHYQLHEGLVVAGSSGGEGWNPLQSGRTLIELNPFYEYLDVRNPNARQQQSDTNGVRLSAIYDNRDFPLSPGRGNLTNITVARDLGLLGSSNPWTNLSASFAEYIPLGTSSLFRQQVLALTGWTSYSPTWKHSGSPGHGSPSDAPPFYEGANLGGMERLRGFPEERFHDRAGIYGCAELRLIPNWNPLGQIPLFKSSDVTWMQFVAFVEVGRVADEYTFDKLFSHMKGDAGVGLRVLTADTVVRFDIAASNEGIQIWANLDQAF